MVCTIAAASSDVLLRLSVSGDGRTDNDPAIGLVADSGTIAAAGGCSGGGGGTTNRALCLRGRCAFMLDAARHTGPGCF